MYCVKKSFQQKKLIFSEPKNFYLKIDSFRFNEYKTEIIFKDNLGYL